MRDRKAVIPVLLILSSGHQTPLWFHLRQQPSPSLFGLCHPLYDRIQYPLHGTTALSIQEHSAYVRLPVQETNKVCSFPITPPALPPPAGAALGLRFRNTCNLFVPTSIASILQAVTHNAEQYSDGNFRRKELRLTGQAISRPTHFAVDR